MIRRLKKDVLSQLPPKRRQRIMLSMPAKQAAQFKAQIEQLQELEKVPLLPVLGVVEARLGPVMLTCLWCAFCCNHKVAEDGNALDDERMAASSRKRNLIMKLYVDTGVAKLAAVREYVSDMLECGAKFLVFAHHLPVLDGVEECVKQRKVKYIRIDGSTASSERQRLVALFQQRTDVRVAILSITAAGTGLTLTAAHTVVFAELHWTPGVLMQAEDRVHRIGQNSSAVNIQYLIAHGTCDDLIWDSVAHKMRVVGKALDGESVILSASKGESNKAAMQEQVSNGRALASPRELGRQSDAGQGLKVPKTGQLRMTDMFGNRGPLAAPPVPGQVERGEGQYEAQASQGRGDLDGTLPQDRQASGHRQRDQETGSTGQEDTGNSRSCHDTDTADDASVRPAPKSAVPAGFSDPGSGQRSAGAAQEQVAASRPGSDAEECGRVGELDTHKMNLLLAHPVVVRAMQNPRLDSVLEKLLSGQDGQSDAQFVAQYADDSEMLQVFKTVESIMKSNRREKETVGFAAAASRSVRNSSQSGEADIRPVAPLRGGGASGGGCEDDTVPPDLDSVWQDAVSVSPTRVETLHAKRGLGGDMVPLEVVSSSEVPAGAQPAKTSEGASSVQRPLTGPRQLGENGVGAGKGRDEVAAAELVGNLNDLAHEFPGCAQYLMHELDSRRLLTKAGRTLTEDKMRSVMKRVAERSSKPDVKVAEFACTVAALTASSHARVPRPGRCLADAKARPRSLRAD